MAASRPEFHEKSGYGQAHAGTKSALASTPPGENAVQQQGHLGRSGDRATTKPDAP